MAEWGDEGCTPQKTKSSPLKSDAKGRRSFPVKNDPHFQLEVVAFLGESNHLETSVSKFKGRESPNLIGFPYSICPFFRISRSWIWRRSLIFSLKKANDSFNVGWVNFHLLRKDLTPPKKTQVPSRSLTVRPWKVTVSPNRKPDRLPLDPRNWQRSRRTTVRRAMFGHFFRGGFCKWIIQTT